MDRRRKNANSRIIILLAWLILPTFANAQKVSFSDKDDIAIYTRSMNSILKNDRFGYILPDRLFISGNVLDYITEFMAEKTTSPTVKKTWSTKEWSFVPNADTVNYKRTVKVLKTRKLFLDTKEKLVKRAPVRIDFSPVIYSENHDKAVVIYQRSATTDMLERLVFYFVKQNGVWTLVNTQVPYWS